MMLVEYDVDVDVLMWGDTYRPIISLDVLDKSQRFETWLPDFPNMWNLKWWRWN